jgi:hypothetical protein
MNSIERFYATIERRPVDRPASWLGIPDKHALPARQSDYCEILRAIAAENSSGNLHLLEGADLLTDYSGMTKDLIHPGDYGHTEMGWNLAAAVRRKILS